MYSIVRLTFDINELYKNRISLFSLQHFEPTVQRHLLAENDTAFKRITTYKRYVLITGAATSVLILFKIINTHYIKKPSLHYIFPTF